MNGLVAEMLEITRPDIELIAQHEDEKAEACESRSHGKGINGHVAAQPASYLVSFPCGRSMLMCTAWVTVALMSSDVLCNGSTGCGSYHPSGLIVIIELPSK